MRACVIALATLALVTGCNATYAPPLRAVQYGAPARLLEGQTELGGTVGGTIAPTVGGPHLAVAIRDWAAVEVGGNFLFVGHDQHQWAMGFVGGRLSYVSNRRARIQLVGDLELGAGGGLGGAVKDNLYGPRDCSYCDGLSSLDRLAYGAYQGAGLGLRIRWFTIYGRLRLEETTATNVPLTLWPSATVGMEFRVSDRVALSTGAGLMAYANSRDHATGIVYQLGLTLFFDRVERPHPPAAGAAPWSPAPPLDPLPPSQPPPLDPGDPAEWD